MLKDDIREKILDAAKRKFAQQRYIDTTIADIAEEANASVGNIYRYYQNKHELFLSAVTLEVTASLEELLLRTLSIADAGLSPHLQRTAGLARGALLHGTQRVMASGGTSVDPSDEEKELYAFLTRYPHESIILLERYEGTPYDGFRKRVVEGLAKKHRARNQMALQSEGVLIPIVLENLLTGMVAVLRTAQGHEKKETILANLFRFYKNGLKAI